jgi:hypothetical protein
LRIEFGVLGWSNGTSPKEIGEEEEIDDEARKSPNA